METPRFLLADNTDHPEVIFLVHTQYPRFVWNMDNDEVEWLDQLDGEEEELVNEISELMETAEAFYEREIERHEQEQ